MANETEAATEATAQEVPSLELQDLAVLLNVVNAAIKRGVFEPNELASVGTLYTKLESFLKYQAAAVAARQKELEAAAAAGEEAGE